MGKAIKHYLKKIGGSFFFPEDITLVTSPEPSLPSYISCLALCILQPPPHTVRAAWLEVMRSILLMFFVSFDEQVIQICICGPTQLIVLILSFF